MKKITKIYCKYINIWLKFFNVLRYFQESVTKAHLKGKKKGSKPGKYRQKKGVMKGHALK